MQFISKSLPRRRRRMRTHRQKELTWTLGLMVLVVLAAFLGSHYAETPSPKPRWELPFSD